MTPWERERRIENAKEYVRVSRVLIPGLIVVGLMIWAWSERVCT